MYSLCQFYSKIRKLLNPEAGGERTKDVEKYEVASDLQKNKNKNNIKQLKKSLTKIKIQNPDINSPKLQSIEGWPLQS